MDTIPKVFWTFMFWTRFLAYKKGVDGSEGGVVAKSGQRSLLESVLRAFVWDLGFLIERTLYGVECVVLLL